MSITQEKLEFVIKLQNKHAKNRLRGYVHRDIENRIVEEQTRNNFVVLLSGVRRSGKSTLLTYLRTKHFKSDYYINFDDDRLVGFDASDFDLLLNTFVKLYGESQYVFLDEVQNVNGWERFVNRLKEQGYKVFVTGSNSKLLSREFGTYLTGRYVVYKIYPFSFVEYIRYKEPEILGAIQEDENLLLAEKSPIIEKYFEEYLKYGGFPEFLRTKSVDFLKNLYESILYKDIIARYDIQSDFTLKQLANTAVSNIARPISYRSYKSFGIKSSTTVSQYFEYLTNTFLFFLLPKFAFSIRSQILSKKKLYVIDNALANYINFRPTQDYGRFLENTVFLHLIRQPNVDLFYYADTKAGFGSFECDFVQITRTLDDRYINLVQVTRELNTENIKREILGIVGTYDFLYKAGYKIKDMLILTHNQFDEIHIDKLQTLIKQNVQVQLPTKAIKVMPAWYYFLRYLNV